MDDLISRQAAINAIHEDADWLAAQGSDWQVERMERDKSILKSLPPVQPKRIEGAWINEGRIIRCDKCKIGYAAVKGMKSALTYNFCPNCGADMRCSENPNS